MGGRQAGRQGTCMNKHVEAEQEGYTGTQGVGHRMEGRSQTPVGPSSLHTSEQKHGWRSGKSTPGPPRTPGLLKTAGGSGPVSPGFLRDRRCPSAGPSCFYLKGEL